jgi:hypothetical protein
LINATINIFKTMNNDTTQDTQKFATKSSNNMPPIENVEHQEGSADADADADDDGDTEQKDDLLESTLEALPALLKQRKKQLVEGERALKKAMLAFQKEKTTVCGDASPSDVVHLNVGGTKMQVLRRTLTSVPGSMLASKFSGRWDESMERDRDGNFFIDQSFAAFELMINYLRAKACQTPNAPPLESPTFYRDDATVSKVDFLRMLEYYGMVLGLHPIKIGLYSSIPSEVEYKGDLGITNSSDWATFGIEAQGHQLTIKSFEVTIREVERAQIGWRSSGKVGTSEIAGVKGIGEMPSTVALDCCRSVMLVNGALIPIDGRCKDGSTIRCEDGGNKWYVDGRLVASTNQADNVTLIEWNVTGMVESPAISVKGSFCVSDVEYRLY